MRYHWWYCSVYRVTPRKPCDRSRLILVFTLLDGRSQVREIITAFANAKANYVVCTSGMKLRPAPLPPKVPISYYPDATIDSRYCYSRHPILSLHLQRHLLACDARNDNEIMNQERHTADSSLLVVVQGMK
jgi:hypothetical protein